MVLSTANPVPEGFRRQTRNVVRQTLGLGLLQEFRGEEPVVRVYIIQQAPEPPDVPIIQAAPGE